MGLSSCDPGIERLLGIKSRELSLPRHQSFPTAADDSVYCHIQINKPCSHYHTISVLSRKKSKRPKNFVCPCGDRSSGSTLKGLSHSIEVVVTNFVLNVRLDSSLRYGTKTNLLKLDCELQKLHWEFRGLRELQIKSNKCPGH